MPTVRRVAGEGCYWRFLRGGFEGEAEMADIVKYALSYYEGRHLRGCRSSARADSRLRIILESPHISNAAWPLRKAGEMADG